LCTSLRTNEKSIKVPRLIGHSLSPTCITVCLDLKLPFNKTEDVGNGVTVSSVETFNWLRLGKLC
jgi:hypothetical protein